MCLFFWEGAQLSWGLLDFGSARYVALLGGWFLGFDLGHYGFCGSSLSLCSVERLPFLPLKKKRKTMCCLFLLRGICFLLWVPHFLLPYGSGSLSPLMCVFLGRLPGT